MALSCLVYIAKMQPNVDTVQMHELKDTTTRLRAHNRISGALFMAGGYLFEIMEGEYAILESNLDQISSSGVIEDPEVLIFATLKKQQFQTWKMGNLEGTTPTSQDYTAFQSLGEQTLADPSSVPSAAIQMLKLFSDQFAPKDDTGSRAA